ncbi:MAG TPA: sulfurtransferase [Gemmataceae bacterium]|jgi:thiosulfate/3-mercaptopyruvate sulfurtransferase|nr:sulfurtransferase [Gemmataceae bacterium]
MTSHAVAASALLILTAASNSNGEVEYYQYPRRNLLVEPADLSTPLARKGIRLLDTRSKEKYDAGHMPGALYTDAAAWAKAFNTAPDATAWSHRIGDQGIDVNTRVVVYGEGDTPDAARIWWILRYWGIKDVRLLNGGWPAWRNCGGEVSKDEPQLSPASPRLAPQKSRLKTIEELLEETGKPQTQIVDARSQAEFCGEKNTAKRNGAIPGAVHLEWKELIDASNQRFKSPEELARLFKEKHIDLNRPIVTHCQSGGRAAVMAFALELMGAKHVSNYYKSWAEWGNAENTPVVKPKQ